MVSKENFNLFFTNPSHNSEEFKKWEVDRNSIDFDPLEKFGKDVVVYRNKFLSHKLVSWDDIIYKMEKEYNQGYTNFLYFTDFMPSETITMNETSGVSYTDDSGIQVEIPKGDRLPTIVTHTTLYMSDRLKDAVIEAHNLMGVKFLHMYNNFIDNSFILDRHKDDMSVLIVAVKGDVEYSFDSGEKHLLHPGDAIYIPRGTYHKPKVFGARSTFSYCWSYIR